MGGSETFGWTAASESHMPTIKTTRFIALALVVSAPLLANEPPSPKPNPGPEPAERREAPKPDPKDPVHKRYSDSVNARDKADLMRAAYEKEHKPGPVPEDASKQFEKMVEAYRAAIDIDPRGEAATYCRQRLSGAYTYTGDYDAGLRILVEAVNIAAGPLDQIKACVSATFSSSSHFVRFYSCAASLILSCDHGREVRHLGG